MKKVILVFIIAHILSCKKDQLPIVSPSAALTVVNTIVNGGTVQLNTNLRDSALTNNYKQFFLVSGLNVPIRVYPKNNPAAIFYQQSISINPGDIYSLFLAGTTGSPDGVLVKDNIAPFATDSIVNIRVVNLMANGGVLSVNQASSPSTVLFSGLNYKTVSDFKPIPFPTLVAPSTNIFQIRNAGGTILTSYTLPPAGTISIASGRFKSITLVIKGLQGNGPGPSAPGIIALPHY